MTVARVLWFAAVCVKVLVFTVRWILGAAVGLILIVVALASMVRRLCVGARQMWRSWRGVDVNNPANTTPLERSTCCDAGIITSNVDGFLCEDCHGRVPPAHASRSCPTTDS